MTRMLSRSQCIHFVHSCTQHNTRTSSCRERTSRQRIAQSGPKHHLWFGRKRGGLCTSFSGGRSRECCSCGGLWQLHPHSGEKREHQLFKCFWQRYTHYLTKVISRGMFSPMKSAKTPQSSGIVYNILLYSTAIYRKSAVFYILHHILFFTFIQTRCHRRSG